MVCGLGSRDGFIDGLSSRQCQGDPLKGPFLTLLLAVLKGTLRRGSIALRVPLILTPTLTRNNLPI